MICNDHSPLAAKKAIAAFLSRPVEEISAARLGGGSEEAVVYRCNYLSEDYVIKFFCSTEQGKYEIAWSIHVSHLGVGPKFFYGDTAGHFMIIEFVKGDTLVPSTANTPYIIKSVAASTKKLHQSTVTFAHESDMFLRMDEKYTKLHSSGELKSVLERGFTKVGKKQMKLQSLNIPPVPCHNDLNPGNVFSRNSHVVLIDWGDAALGNPYYDIAAFFVLNLIQAENESLFFEHYDPKLCAREWQERMRLYKQLVHFEFALNLLLGVQASKSDLLHQHAIPEVKDISHYLVLLAGREVEIDSAFLYNMAVAALYQS